MTLTKTRDSRSLRRAIKSFAAGIPSVARDASLALGVWGSSSRSFHASIVGQAPSQRNRRYGTPSLARPSGGALALVIQRLALPLGLLGTIALIDRSITFAGARACSR